MEGRKDSYFYFYLLREDIITHALSVNYNSFKFEGEKKYRS